MDIRKMAAIAAAAVVLVTTACTATRTRETFGETIDDGTTTTRVKAALIANPATEARNIDVETRRGVVQLNGFVNSEPGRAAATRTAADVAGVKSVENNLQLKGPERSASAVIDDGVISAQVKLALANDPATHSYQIDVATRAGRVELAGWVDTADMRSAAGRIAAKVEGVKDVDNKIDVKH